MTWPGPGSPPLATCQRNRLDLIRGPASGLAGRRVFDDGERRACATQRLSRGRGDGEWVARLRRARATRRQATGVRRPLPRLPLSRRVARARCHRAIPWPLLVRYFACLAPHLSVAPHSSPAGGSAELSSLVSRLETRKRLAI